MTILLITGLCILTLALGIVLIAGALALREGINVWREERRLRRLGIHPRRETII